MLENKDNSNNNFVEGRNDVTSEAAEEQNCDGTVAVKDGKLVVKNPVGLGKYPTISPCAAIKLIVNGQLVNDVEIVTENTHLEVILPDEVPGPDLEIVVSEDELEAYCSINPGKTYRLVDQGETNHLLLRVETIELPLLSTVSLDVVKNKLNTLGIKHGVRLEEIERELQQPTGKPVLIARGTPQVPSQNSWIQYLFDINEKKGPEVKENERVDYYERGQIQAVEVGSVLAVKHSSFPGKAGLTITGKEIRPEETRDVEINIGKGVQLVDDGQKAVATIAGRPVLIGPNKTINILPQLTINGDVDLSTGHVKFNGDVCIQGSVMEGLIVQASGRVTVLENVYSARIIAGEGVTVNGNVISSQICAGGNSAFFTRVIPLLKELLHDLDGIVAAVEQLKSNSMFLMQDLHLKGEGNLIKILIDTKFGTIPKTVEKIEASVQPAVYKLETFIRDFIKLLKLKLTKTGPLNIRSVDEVVKIKQLCIEVIRQGEEAICSEANVTARYVQNTFIEATGSVEIFGQGSYQTKIFAGKEVDVRGVFRGGEIQANGSVKISTAGSNAAVQTKIEVGEKGRVTVSNIFPNVEIKIGPHALKMDNVIRNFQGYRDSQNKLVIKGNKMEGVINA